MNLEQIIESGWNVNVTLTPAELVEVIDYVIQKTKIEFENELMKKNAEVYMSSKEVCDFLSIANSTLWRWEKQGYLRPQFIGGKKRYPRSEIQKRFSIMNN